MNKRIPLQNVGLSLTFTLFLISLTGCELMGTKPFSDRTPILWDVSLSGFGEVERVDSLLLGMADLATEDRLVAVDLDNRDIAWKSDVVNFQSGRLVTASKGDYIYAQIIQAEGFYIYTKRGELISHVRFPDPFESRSLSIHPTIDSNKLYISNGRHLYAYDLTDPVNPSLVWKISYDYDFKTMTVDNEGNLFVSMATTKDLDVALKQLNPVDGSVIWQASTRTEEESVLQRSAYTLEVDGGKLFAIAFGTVQAFSKETGERLWVSELLRCSSDGIQSIYAMELAEGNAYIAPAGGSCVFGVDLTDGNILWMHNAKVVPSAWFSYGGKPKYYNGVVYATNSYLWALDAQTGEVLSLSKIQDRLATQTYIQEYNGEILVWGEKLRAYKPVR